MDTRALVDCAFYLRGSCGKGSACPFRHDPTKITAHRQVQGQQNCIFFLQGRCTKGSLCPFKHDVAKLPAQVQAVGGAAGPSAEPAAAATSVTIDFGSGDAQQQVHPASTAALTPAPKAVAASRVTPGTRPSPATVPSRAGRQGTSALGPQQHQQQPVGSRKQQPAAVRSPLVKEASSAKAPSATAGAPAAIPSRLAGRLGPALAVQDKEPNSKPQVKHQ
jgi:hypothetical protein